MREFKCVELFTDLILYSLLHSHNHYKFAMKQYAAGPSEAVIESSSQRGCEAAEYSLLHVARKFFTPLRSRRALVASLTSGIKF